MAESGLLRIENTDAVRIISMNRPDKLNALNTDLLLALRDALDAADQDDGVRALVLTGEGRGFSAGADLSEFRGERTPEQVKRNALRSSLMSAIQVKLRTLSKPVVAAVHGAAIGGGLGVACAADFRVTCPEARFAANFTKLGFHPGFGLTVLLTELVGKNQAELLFYTGRRIGGEEAVRIGLASVCVPQDQVRAEATKLAAEIAESAPLAIISTRKTMRGDLADRVKTATDHELKEQTWLRATEDFKEGVKATNERRVANWKGR